MSRIVALFYRDHRPVEQEILARLVAPLKNRATDAPRFWLGGAAGLAYQCLQNSLGLDELQPRELGGRYSICFDGRLDNREELIRELGPELNSEAASVPDAILVMGCYRRFGDMFAARLNGDFALALFDVDRQRMLLARDVIGVRPLYYWVSGDTFIAASEVKAILAHPQVTPQPDDNVIADLLVGGNPNELRLTLYRNVLRVLPGHTVIVTLAGVREFKHWDFDPTRQIRLGSIDEYAEVLRGLFKEAVRRRLRTAGAVAVTVSGGLDSSAILCQAEALGKAGEPVSPVRGISQLYPEGSAADERHYLEEIEALCGVEIRRLPPSPIRTSTDRDWPWRIEYPYLPANNEMDCLDGARSLGCGTVLDGFYGDQILWSNASVFDSMRAFRWLEAQGKFLALSRSMTDCSPRQLRNELFHCFARDLAPDRLLALWRCIRRWLGRGNTPKWYSHAIRDVAYRRSQLQRRRAGPFASKQAELCYVLIHSSHISLSMEMSNKFSAYLGLEMAYPFADRDLVSFMMAIPGEIVLWKGVYKGLFREAIRGVLPEAIRSRYWKADFTQLTSDAAAGLHSTGLSEYLGPHALAVSRGYIDIDALPTALAKNTAELKEYNFLPSKQLNELLSLELWLRAYFAPGYSEGTN